MFFTIFLGFTIIGILKRGIVGLGDLNNLLKFQMLLTLEPRFGFRSDTFYNLIWTHNNYVECTGPVAY
jgi:hypothetical protein